MKTRSRGQNSVAVVGLESGPLLLTIGSFRFWVRLSTNRSRKVDGCSKSNNPTDIDNNCVINNKPLAEGQVHDAGNHRSIERGSDLQAARRSSLSRRPNLPESIKIDAALTPQLGARSRIIAKICPIVSQMRSWTADIRAGFLRELSGCSHIAAGRRDARSAYFLLYQREGAIGRARRDGTIAFHCGISGALLVHFLRRFDPR